MLLWYCSLCQWLFTEIFSTVAHLAISRLRSASGAALQMCHCHVRPVYVCRCVHVHTRDNADCLPHWPALSHLVYFWDMFLICMFVPLVRSLLGPAAVSPKPDHDEAICSDGADMLLTVAAH